MLIVWCFAPLSTMFQLHHGDFWVSFQYYRSTFPDTSQSVVLLTSQPWTPWTAAITIFKSILYDPAWEHKAERQNLLSNQSWKNIHAEICINKYIIEILNRVENSMTKAANAHHAHTSCIVCSVGVLGCFEPYFSDITRRQFNISWSVRCPKTICRDWGSNPVLQIIEPVLWSAFNWL